MPLAYSIAAADVVQTARLDAASPEDTADAQAILEAEQESLETGIRPEFLSDLRFRPLIRRQIIKLLAAELIALRARKNDGMDNGTFQGAGVLVGRGPDQAALLRGEARAYLAPYVRRAPTVALP